MPIFVRILNGKTFTLSLQLGQKISSLQYWIMKKEDIPGYMQKLFLAGMSLQVGDHTLAHYNIVAGSTLDLVVNGKEVAPNAEISVETACGKKFPVVVNYDLLIEDVKKLIEDKVHIPLKQQRLVYAGVELEDARLLRTYDFQEKDTFWLVIDDASMEMKTRVSMRIQIQVSATKKTIHLDVGSTDTIRDVKAKIQAREHIPTGQQVVAKCTEVVCYLLACRLRTGIVVKICSKIVLKAKIHAEKGIPMDQQVLFLTHKRLDDSFTLADTISRKVPPSIYLAQNPPANAC
ncbi:putative Ubiquitin-like domain-containing protein [Helianthus annuus]|nr:putative Ubiquitin-like domain-containing protein [Helianthus annuus]KAJ0748933.1 putative Ubiquitin-like domain-containing protein [Helianthus annuus]